VEIGHVHYARNGNVRLAYRILGDGDTTLVWVPGWTSNVELLDEPQSPFTAFFEQLAGDTRFIAWDKRGTGLSDPVIHVPPLDERMDDLRAMDAAATARRFRRLGWPDEHLVCRDLPPKFGYWCCADIAAIYPTCPTSGVYRRSEATYRARSKHISEGALATSFWPDRRGTGFRDFYGRVQRLSAAHDGADVADAPWTWMREAC
jgi:pimeloyl-ACP methyl ester carboxylesterase